MKTEVIREEVVGGRDWVVKRGNIELFRGRAGKAADKAHDLADALNAHEGDFVVETSVENNQRVYFVRAGGMVVKKSTNANRIHDFADRLNGNAAEVPEPKPVPEPEPAPEPKPVPEPESEAQEAPAPEDPFA